MERIIQGKQKLRRSPYIQKWNNVIEYIGNAEVWNTFLLGCKISSGKPDEELEKSTIETHRKAAESKPSKKSQKKILLVLQKWIKKHKSKETFTGYWRHRSLKIPPKQKIKYKFEKQVHQRNGVLQTYS